MSDIKQGKVFIGKAISKLFTALSDKEILALKIHGLDDIDYIKLIRKTIDKK